ncbi:unnamed protein product [Tuber melanosporum]|uniref:(Perigord truffle) hypothetical protein n=1 Tax=Tuber melanosporum (strain Mel28) TaxID=656061 RepID=D5G658_TUBMM|nr:uncharacterized protein GSTUM_00001782001 [Tuber melanosporum]CAZ80001.1 unnamed protein product [Tuber melanosporum]
MDSNEEEGRGERESNFSKPPLPSSTVQPPREISHPWVAVPEPYRDRFGRDGDGDGSEGGGSGDRARSKEMGEKGPAGRATDTTGTKGILGAAAGLWSGDIGVNVGGMGSPLIPEAKERTTVELQPEEIGGVGIGTSAERDGAIRDSGVSDKNGREAEAVEAEGGVEGPTETGEILEYSGGVKGAPKADEGEAKLSARVLDREHNTRGRYSALSPRHLPEIKETSPSDMAREASSTDLKSIDIGHNGGATEGHDRAINSKQHDKPPAKRVSFAPEPSESSSREGSTGPQDKELEKIPDVSAEPGYNLERSKGHDIPTDDKRHGQPTGIKFQLAQKSGENSGTKELWKVSDNLGESGSIKDQDRTIHEKQNQPVGKSPSPTQKSRLNPETEELEKIADVVGEFGYNIGITEGHDRAIDNRNHDKPASNNAHAPGGLASENQLPYVGVESTSKPPELGNITIESGEFRYNVGGQSSFDPGRHKTHGADARGLGAGAETSECQRSDDTSGKTPAANGTAESRELGNFTIETGDFGYNVGGLPSSHPDRHRTHRRRPSRPFQGGDGTRPEVEELGRITMKSGEFRYPSSHPDRHRRYSHGDLQDQADQKTSKSRWLDQTKPRNSEFGSSIGGLEHRQRGKEEENPTASGSMHRNEQPANRDPSRTSSIRDSVRHGHPDKGDNCFTHTKETQQQPLLSVCSPGGTTTAEVIAPENPSTPPGQQSQTITTHPHPKEVRSREGGMRRILVWGVLGVGVIIALGFAALRGGFKHPVIGFGLGEGVGWSDKLAGWLFKEGKKGPS